MTQHDTENNGSRLSSDRPDCEVNDSSPQVTRLTEAMSSGAFDDWYREREIARNIREGQHYFNGPSRVKAPRQHSPSSLKKCHRKTFYNQLNAPEEREDPAGIFWFGSRFEEALVLSFLEDAVVGEDEYVANSLWVDFTINTDVGELSIRGETDPVIVDSNAKPILLTEIKTKQSIENLDAPNTHHEAQAHAYMKGLSEKHDRKISEAVILYGSRKALNLKAFSISYDPYFWRNSVVEWAETLSAYRLNDELPPADPEFSWECKFCPYQERCGRGEKEYSDNGPAGLLPLYSDYPREKLVAYLRAHDGAKLTPVLAQMHPELAAEYGAFDWTCPECARDFGWNKIEWNSHSSKPPQCPVCEDDGVRSWLRGPAPESQHDIRGPNDDQ